MGDAALRFVWIELTKATSTHDDVPVAVKDVVSGWRSRYPSVPVTVHTYADCLSAVESIESADPTGLTGLTAAFQHPTTESAVTSVDIGRVALLYLNGGVYLDTDMDVGALPLPSDVLRPSDRVYLPTDADGLVQNCFISSPPKHPFLRLLLHVFARHSRTGNTVLDAAGPVCLTAVYQLFQSSAAQSGVVLLPAFRLFPTHWHGPDTDAPPDTSQCYGVHRWAMSWRPSSSPSSYDDDYGTAYDYTTPSPSSSSTTTTTTTTTTARLLNRVSAVRLILSLKLLPSSTHSTVLSTFSADPKHIARITPPSHDTPSVRSAAGRQLCLLSSQSLPLSFSVSTPSRQAVTCHLSPTAPASSPSLSAVPSQTRTAVTEWLSMAFSPQSDAERRLVAAASPTVVVLRPSKGQRCVGLSTTLSLAGSYAVSVCPSVTVLSYTAASLAADDVSDLSDAVSVAAVSTPVLLTIDDVDDVTGRQCDSLVDALSGLSSSANPVRVLLSVSSSPLSPSLRRLVGPSVLTLGVPSDVSERNAVIGCHLSTNSLTPSDVAALARLTHGLSIGDVARVCRLTDLLVTSGSSPLSAVSDAVTVVTDSLSSSWSGGGGAVTVSKSVSSPDAATAATTSLTSPATPATSWHGVAGYTDVVDRLTRLVVWPLTHSAALTRLGLSSPSGVLLWGPSGCGKSLFASATAAAAGLSLISVKAPELMSRYVGDSEDGVRQLFARARGQSPCIIFLDELDAMASKRSLTGGSTGSSGTSVHDRVLSTLLNEMDGVEASGGVIVMGATTDKALIDDALIRRGRFDESLFVGFPSKVSRAAIFRHHLRRTPVQADVSVDRLSDDAFSLGFSGADIAAVCKEAVMSALRRSVHCDAVTPQDFEQGRKVVTAVGPLML